MRETGFRGRLRYWFDNVTSRGTEAMIVLLFVLTVLLVVTIALVVVLADIDPEGRGFIAVAWAGLMRTLDPGTMGGDTGSPGFLLAMLAVTVGGIFVVGTLIGIITTGIDSKLQQLRKGRSFVAEEGHTIILGWSSQVFTVVSEIVEANANQRRECIAILAPRDKVEMEDEIRERIEDTMTTRVVCRTGSPIDQVDLRIVNHEAARSIIILPPEEGDADSGVIKTALALIRNPDRRPEPYHIVGVLRDQENMRVAEMIGGDELRLILAGDMIARISAQTCRQSGLSMVYRELLDFAGDEIYFKEEPTLAGRTYGEMLHLYEDSALIGFRRADGGILINPPPDTLFERGDSVIAVTEDDDTIRLSGTDLPQVDESVIVTAPRPPDAPERTLVLGWNRRVPTIARELDGYVAPGSVLTIVSDPGTADLAELGELEPASLEITTLEGVTTDRGLLDRLGLQDYDHVIVQSMSDTLETQEADARTLVTILHLRDIRTRTGSRFSIVSEMLDDRNRQLAEVASTDDFIVSDKLISLMLAQVSENAELLDVFSILFDPEGSETYLRPASLYVEPGREVDFHTVVASAARRGETAIGYRDVSRADENDGGVIVNPVKSERLVFSGDDMVIVLAED